MNMFLELYMKILKRLEADGRAEAKANYEDGIIEEYDPVTLTDVWFDDDEIYYDPDTKSIHITGMIKHGRHELGYTSLDVEVPLAVLVEAIVDAIKNNNKFIEKLKVVLNDRQTI